MAAIKRNFLLPSGIGISAENLYLKSSAASTTYTTGALIVAGGVGIGGSLTINGDLTVSGTTFTVNSVTLTVDDKNIELGSVTSPSDITAEAGGITLKGATDKFINWYTGTGWSSNESLNLASGLVYKIANTSVISASSIGTGITNSSLTALGTITTGTWAGSTITARYGGTGITSYTVGDVLYANTTSTLAKITAGTAGSVLASAGAGATPYYADPNVLVTSSSGATSRNVNVTSASTNSTHYLAFTPASGTVAGAALSSGSAITANPNTGTISATTFTGTTGSFTTVNAQGSTASTYFGNGALVVTGGAGISGQLSFNSAALGYTGASNPSMAFIGSTNVAPITLTATSDGAILFEGSSGKLFGINNNLSSGWIFNVGDISGLPIIRANADGTIAMAEFMANVGIGLSNPQYKLHVTGSVGFTASTASISTTSGALIVTGGVGIGGSINVGGVSSISGVILNSGVITGSLTGTATTSTNINVGVTNTSSTVYPVFSGVASTTTGTGLSSSGSLSYVPSTGTLTATGFVGSLTGFATTGRNVNTVAAGNSNIAHLMLFSTASGTVSGAAISNNTTFSFNPSTEILSVSGVAVTAGTASSNSATGALRVSGGLGVSGQLSFNTASLGSTGYSNPSIIFSGSAGSAPITLTVQSDNTLSWEGTSGQLFAIDNNLTTGDIFSVSDISGLPIINASAGQTVSINEFGGFTRIGNGSISSTGASNANADGSLVVYGGVGITGNLSLGGVIRSGNNTFTKSGLGSGDIALDNGTFDTPAVLFYWSNNKNMGIDTYYAGSGTTKFRIVKELNESGGSELWSVDRNGLVNRSAWDVGEVIASRAYDYLALGMQSTTSIGITSNVAIGTTVYTPKSSASYLWIEFDADYDFNNGTTADSYYATIKANNTDVAIKQQIFLNAVGGGTRSSVLFPISGRYTNSTTSGVAITVYGRRNSSDDDLRVFGNTTSGFMRIQEIGR